MTISTPAEITATAVSQAEYKATSRPFKSFLSAITAGAYIAIGFAFFITSQQGTGMPLGAQKVLGGVVFSTGLMLVVVTGSELFTSSTLLLTGIAEHRVTWPQLLRNWLIVWCGNFLGALIVVAVLFGGATWESNKGAWGKTLLGAAEGKLDHNAFQAFCLGIACNVLVCAAVWLAYAGKSLTDKLLAVIFPVAMFVAAGFEHSVANMFLVPFALIVKEAAPSDFWTMIGTQSAAYPHLSWGRFLLGNLLPVTLGNIIGGGVFIGLTNVAITRLSKH